MKVAGVNIKRLVLVACLYSILTSVGAWAEVTIHVTPTANPQTTLADLKRNPDIPVTLTQALAILKDPALRDAKGTPKESIAIHLGAGTYRLDETLNIDAASSGSAEQPVSIEGPKDASAIISGGRAVNGFTPVTDPATLARLSATARPHVLQANLATQGITDYGQQFRHGFGASNAPTALEVTYRNQPMTLARWPDQGFAKIATTPDGEKGFAFTVQGANLQAWKDEPELLATGYWLQDWADATIPINAIDLASERITLTEPSPPYGIKAGQRVFIQNALAELDQPGEWYLDKTHGLLYFWPPESPKENESAVISKPVIPVKTGKRAESGEFRDTAIQPQEPNAVIPAQAGLQPVQQNVRPPAREQQNLFPSNSIEVEVSLLKKLLVIGNASHIRIDNVTFQSARGDAITVRGGHHVSIANSVIRNIGNRAAVISGQDNGLTDMLIENIGEGGVVLEGGDRQTLTPANLYVERSTIRRFARVSRAYQPAVWLTGVGNRAASNKISDAPHTAILFAGNDHLITGNEIFDVCTDTGDAGSIYTGRDWTARGTVISDNHIHDIPPNISWGITKSIYLDDQASGITVRGNLFERLAEAVFIGGGRDNLIEDNKFIDTATAIHLDARGEAAIDDSILRKRLAEVPYNKSPYKERYPHLANILEDEPGAPKYNIARRNLVIGNSTFSIGKNAEGGINLEGMYELRGTKQ